MEIIVASIDLNLLDQKWFKEMKRKSGADACFVDLVLIPSPKSKFDDYFIAQGISQEARKAGEQGEIIGNAKIMGGSGPRRSAPSDTHQDRSGGMDQAQRPTTQRRREAPAPRYGRPAEPEDNIPF